MRRFLKSPHWVGRIARNSLWLFLDRAVRLGGGLLLMVWIARSLGPTSFGKLNFAIAYAALFVPVATLGLNDIVVRDLVRTSGARASVLLGSSFAIQAIASAVAVVAANFVLILAVRDEELRLLSALLSLTLAAKATDAIRSLYDSRLKSRFAVAVDGVTFVGVALLRIYLILTKAPTAAIAATLVAEVWISSLALAVFYRHSGERVAWRTDLGRMRELTRQAAPLALSALTVAIYMRVDQILLAAVADAAEVGYYAAGTRITEVWYAFPMLILISAFPALIDVQQTDPSAYLERYQKLMNMLVTLAILASFALSVSASPLISLLYGTGFTPAATVLSVHAWTCIFVFMGVAGSRWYIAEGLQHTVLIWTASGALLNIGLNLLLVPRFGSAGAAASSVCSQALSAYLLDAISARTRPLFLMKTRALFWLPLFLAQRFRAGRK